MLALGRPHVVERLHGLVEHGGGDAVLLLDGAVLRASGDAQQLSSVFPAVGAGASRGRGTLRALKRSKSRRRSCISEVAILASTTVSTGPYVAAGGKGSSAYKQASSIGRWAYIAPPVCHADLDELPWNIVSHQS